MTNAYLYIRFSHPSQDKGSSQDRQLEDGRAFIEKKGWHLAEAPICDLGRSAWKGVHLSKGNLGKLAKRIFDGDLPHGSIIVCEELDRLSRQKARVTLNWIQRVCDAGYKVATTKNDKLYSAENLDENLLSIMEILLKAQAAWEYVEMLSFRVKKSYTDRLKQARIDNTAVHGIGPAWLKAVGERPNIRWEPVDERVKVIREIFDLTVAGKPPWTIAREFNERGDCPSFAGKLWERTAIVKIIRNPAVEGDYLVGEGKNQVPTGEILVGYYPRIMPADVVAQARDMLNRRRRGSGRNSGAINNLFGQKIRCGDCNGRMMLMGYKSRYLTCYEASRGSGCLNKTTYKYHHFEAAALAQILHLALDETFFRQAEKSNHLGLEIAGVEKALRDTRAKAGRAYDMWDKEQTPTARVRYLEAEAEVAKLTPKLETLKAKHEQAKGAANAEAHLRRIVGVREALADPDDAIRLPARLRVSEALQSVVDWIDCRQYDRGKLINVLLIGGQHFVQFDNEGNLTNLIEPHPDCAPEDIITAFDPPELRQRVHEYVRRRKA